jgi:hypothetical protein
VACVNPDGTLSPSGRKLLSRLPARDAAEGMSHDALGDSTGLPLFRVRASLRELLVAGLVEDRLSLFRRTEAGDAALARDAAAAH